MSTVLRPAEARSGDTLAGATPAPRRPTRPVAGASADALRFAAFAALVLYGCEHWARQVAPTATRTAWQETAVAVAAAGLLTLVGRVAQPGRRRALVGGLLVLATVLALAAAGIPLRFVGWHHWGEFADGVDEGLSSLPNLNVPYRGLDPWVRWTVLAGAALLGVLAAALAWGERRPAPGARRSTRRQLAAALALGVLYGVPVVERNPESPWVSGAGFAVLLALFLGADRVVALRGGRPRAIATLGALVALGLGALVAPQLDGARPWVDYRGLADDLAKRNQTSFDWNHSYTPLDWPRDGREVLRVRAKAPSYWKATVLRRFDGLRWVQQEPLYPDQVDTPRPADEPGWYDDIKVTVRSMRSDQYIGAGYTNAIRDVPRPASAAGSGTWVTSTRALRPGDTYTASTYSPRPTVGELRGAGTAYPDYTASDLTLELPRAAGGPPETPAIGFRPAEVTTILFPTFGSGGPLVTRLPDRAAFQGGEGLLEASRYRRTWELAQQLRARSTTPFDLVRRVRRRVQQGARYTERPAQRAVPLDAFLFDTHEGYCQQFSGAMALLLRMAGVPARVASGFTSGSYDSDRKQYIVRDLDAHSWVEAFFPGIGWVTFDPTPTVAPPAAQDTGDGGDSIADAEAAARPTGSDGADAAAATASDPASSTGGDDGGSGSRGPALALGAAVLALAAAAAWWWRRPHVRLGPLEELRRALARSGRPAAPETTLAGLERMLTGSAAAQAYVRKLRLARYAGSAEAPSPAERAALREELGAGLGLRGRLRAWWALPPQRPAGRWRRRAPG